MEQAQTQVSTPTEKGKQKHQQDMTPHSSGINAELQPLSEGIGTSSKIEMATVAERTAGHNADKALASPVESIEDGQHRSMSHSSTGSSLADTKLLRRHLASAVNAGTPNPTEKKEDGCDTITTPADSTFGHDADTLSLDLGKDLEVEGGHEGSGRGRIGVKPVSRDTADQGVRGGREGDQALEAEVTTISSFESLPEAEKPRVLGGTENQAASESGEVSIRASSIDMPKGPTPDGKTTDHGQSYRSGSTQFSAKIDQGSQPKEKSLVEDADEQGEEKLCEQNEDDPQGDNMDGGDAVENEMERQQNSGDVEAAEEDTTSAGAGSVGQNTEADNVDGNHAVEDAMQEQQSAVEAETAEEDTTRARAEPAERRPWTQFLMTKSAPESDCRFRWFSLGLFVALICQVLFLAARGPIVVLSGEQQVSCVPPPRPVPAIYSAHLELYPTSLTTCRLLPIKALIQGPHPLMTACDKTLSSSAMSDLQKRLNTTLIDPGSRKEYLETLSDVIKDRFIDATGVTQGKSEHGDTQENAKAWECAEMLVSLLGFVDLEREEPNPAAASTLVQ